MRKVLTVFVALSMLLIAGQVMAGESLMTPKSIDGVTVVDAKWVKERMGEVIVYDVRKKGEFVERHITGAISAPYKEKSAKSVDFDSSKDKMKMDRYPSYKHIPVVVYCNGPKCWKSYKTAVMLVRNGYTNVHWLRDGFPGWLDKGYLTE
jgi:rhodanese-related sulfurtransferase